MVVKLLHFDLPCNLVWAAVLNLNWQVSTVVEAAELAGWDLSLFDGASLRGQDSGLFLGLVQGADLASGTLTALERGLHVLLGDGLLGGLEWLGFQDGGAFLWHVGGREITKSRVLWLWQELVVGDLERLGASSVENVFEVILENKALSEVRFLSSSLHSEFKFKKFLNKLSRKSNYFNKS